MFSITFAAGLFFTVGYPLGLSIVFSILLTWRFFVIRREMFRNRENTYLLITLIFGSSSILFIKDEQILVFVCIQLINLLIGYSYHNISISSQLESPKQNKKLLPIIVCYFTFITASVLSVSDFLQDSSLKVWEVFQRTISYPFKLLSTLIPTLEVDDVQEIQQERATGVSMEENELGSSIWNYVITYVVSYICIGILIMLIGLTMLIRFFRTKVDLHEEEKEQTVVTVQEPNYHKKKYKNSLVKRILFRTPLHPVRKLVYKIEKQANKHKKGRKKFETVEDWLGRIGLTISLNAYQKVRYGNLDINKKEMDSLQVEIEELLRSFHNK